MEDRKKSNAASKARPEKKAGRPVPVVKRLVLTKESLNRVSTGIHAGRSNKAGCSES